MAISINFTLEQQTQFLCEKRIKSYSQYDARVSQQKIEYDAESPLKGQALHGLRKDVV